MNLYQMLVGLKRENGHRYSDMLWELKERGHSAKEVEDVLVEIESISIKESDRLLLVGWYGWGCQCHGLGTDGPTYEAGLFSLEELKRDFRRIPQFDSITTFLGEENSFENLDFPQILLLSPLMAYVPEATTPWPEDLATLLSAEVDYVDQFLAIEVLDELLRRGEQAVSLLGDPEECDSLRDYERKQCRICLGVELYGKVDLYHQLKSCLTAAVIREELEKGAD